MSVSAPFRFAPIHRWVYFPEWGPLVTHDVPFRDGWSGEIELDITAVTPLLVGGARRKPTDALEGEVWPVQLPDGRWAIPPSSLQGMVRSILEIATFAQLGPWIDDKRFGIRDLTPRAAPYYQRRLNLHVKAGWLRKCGGQEFKLKRCDFAKINFRDLARLTDVQRDWGSRSDVITRYGWVPSPELRKNFQVSEGKVTRLEGPTAGKIVLTGNPGATKNHEFFFFNEQEEKELPEGFQDRFEEFLSIHQPNDGQGRTVSRQPNGKKEISNWEFFRDKGYPGEESFNDGGWMPIFYLDDGKEGIESFGLASMFKLAHANRTLDLLRNSNPRHLTQAQRKAGQGEDDPEDGADLPSLIFGSVANDKVGGLKRRAAFDVAIATTLPPGGHLMDEKPIVLLGPKPNYFPIYVRQPNWSKGRLATGEPFATYTPLDEERYPKALGVRKPEHERPELAGVKIWPV
jgi:CRISPR-associated protein (TIGR03986 family)